jgi:hypothetical protein
MIHRAAMYILAFWLCKGTLMPGQSYLSEIDEESSFLLCIILQLAGFPGVPVRYNFSGPSASCPSLAIVAEHSFLYIY